jgi:hypothetical protein
MSMMKKPIVEQNLTMKFCWLSMMMKNPNKNKDKHLQINKNNHLMKFFFISISSRVNRETVMLILFSLNSQQNRRNYKIVK